MKKFKLENPEEKLAILVTQGADQSPSFDSDTLRVTAAIVRVIPGDKIRNLTGDGNGLDNLQAPCRVYPQFDNNPFSWGELNYENLYYVDAAKAKLCPCASSWAIAVRRSIRTAEKVAEKISRAYLKILARVKGTSE